MEQSVSLTPAINRPKATPSSPMLAILKLVGAGSHKLPGASDFDRPSIKITAMTKKVDRRPIIEVYANVDSGTKTDGIKLGLRHYERSGIRKRVTHIARPTSLYVSEVYLGQIDCKESPYNVTRTTLEL